MYKIYKTSMSSPVDYAAEELKKYLRMMMPEGGDIKIAYDPEAKDGFRLGLMQDFGLDVSEAPDVALDDILHIDTDENGGIIAGDNPRSVLLAVYKYRNILSSMVCSLCTRVIAMICCNHHNIVVGRSDSYVYQLNNQFYSVCRRIFKEVILG